MKALVNVNHPFGAGRACYVLQGTCYDIRASILRTRRGAMHRSSLLSSASARHAPATSLPSRRGSIAAMYRATSVLDTSSNHTKGSCQPRDRFDLRFDHRQQPVPPLSDDDAPLAAPAESGCMPARTALLGSARCGCCRCRSHRRARRVAVAHDHLVEVDVPFPDEPPLETIYADLLIGVVDDHRAVADDPPLRVDGDDVAGVVDLEARIRHGQRLLLSAARGARGLTRPPRTPAPPPTAGGRRGSGCP